MITLYAFIAAFLIFWIIGFLSMIKHVDVSGGFISYVMLFFLWPVVAVAMYGKGDI